MSEITTFDLVYPNSAGIDIGSRSIFVGFNTDKVVEYPSFTEGYRKCAKELKEHGITHVAMESTGVYWVGLYEILEAEGLTVVLLNPKEVKQVKGRKTDVQDCKWIQKMFSAGLVRESYIPNSEIRTIRYLVRHREDLIKDASMYINKMQKELEMMNIKLSEVISQIHGVSGLKIIRAIINGERDPQKFLELCDTRIIKNKQEEVLKSLDGNYKDDHIFLLSQHLITWEFFQKQIEAIDEKIGQVLSDYAEKLVIDADVKNFEKPNSKKPKPIRHHAPKIDNLHLMLNNILHNDLTVVPGFSDYTLLRLIGETGVDLEKFPTSKHFVSWCQLAPGNNRSASRKKRLTNPSKSKTGQIFRIVAQSLKKSKASAIGAFIRRLSIKKSTSVAIKAGARKLAEIYYNLITKGTEYVERGVERYHENLKSKEITHAIHILMSHNVNVSNLQAFV